MTDTHMQEKPQQVHQRLLRAYGQRTKDRFSDPVAQLVSTIISQNTNDALRDKAYDCLRERFSTWEQVRDAPTEEVVAAIKIAGLSQHKGPNIQAALRHITKERGVLTLGFLKDLAVEEAKQWLMAMKGVGPKTAAIILLFSLDMPALPVDTHVHRVTRRLGLIPEKASREKAHVLLEEMMPPETYYAFHLNVIRHGREVCHARRPSCDQCILCDLCDDCSTVAHSRPDLATGQGD